MVVHLYGAIAHAGPTPPSADQERLATLLLRLFAPQVLFYGLTTLATALLNAHRRFAAAAFAPVLNNVMLIAVLLAAGLAMGPDTSVAHVESDPAIIWLLGLGTTAGIAAMALVLWPAITRAHIPLRWRFDLHNPAVRQVARLSGWTLGYVVANQVTLFVIISLAFGTPGWRRRVGLDLRLPVLPAALRHLHGVGHDRLHPRAGPPGHRTRAGVPSRTASCSGSAWSPWCCSRPPSCW